MKRMNIKTYIANMYIPIGSYISIRKALMQAGIVTVADLCKKPRRSFHEYLTSREKICKPSKIFWQRTVCGQE